MRRNKANVYIDQILYDRAHEKFFSKDFGVYNNLNNPRPEWREYYIFKNIFKRDRYKTDGYYGAISHKFQEKALISLHEFRDWVKANPGYDCYALNPFPQNHWLFFNHWEQGEYCHPGIKTIADDLFSMSQYDQINPAHYPRSNAETLLYCNFWVGNNKFWEAYVPFLEEMLERVPDKKMRRRLYQITTHIPAPASMFSFISERLLTTFIDFIRPDLRVHTYRYGDKEHEQLCVTKEEVLRLRRMRLLGSRPLAFHDFEITRRRIFDQIRKTKPSREFRF